MSSHESKALSAEWITPPWLLDALEYEFGEFDLDPCACGQALHSRFSSYYTKDMDGLSVNWQGNTFVNPQYGAGIGEWIKQAYSQCRLGNTQQVVLLLPARTDTQWFKHCWDAQELLFLEGRVSFLRPDGSEPGPGAFPSVVVVFRRGLRCCNGPLVSRVSVKHLRKG